jgi:serine/threonine protein kinase
MNAIPNGFVIRFIALVVIVTGTILQFGCLVPYYATTTTTTNQYSVLSSSSHDNDENAITKNLVSCNDYDNKSSSSSSSNDTYNASISRFITEDEKIFQQLEFIEYLGHGQTITAIKCRYQGETYVAKFVGDDDIWWIDFEIDLLRVLNVPPTIPNIPRLELAIQSITNPFLGEHKYLHDTLGVPSKKAKEIAESRRMSFVVTEFVDLSRHHKPRTIRELRIFLRSFFETLAFAHSRRIMHFDLHGGNYHFDGSMVQLIDWNGSFFWEKDKILLIQEHLGFSKRLNPPEGKNNESAVCMYPNSKDIWDVGLLTESLLDTICKKSQNKPDCNRHYESVEDVIKQMLTDDPYKRPNATDLLQHPFLLNQ